jgi:hypothetical protein
VLRGGGDDPLALDQAVTPAEVGTGEGETGMRVR